MSEKTRLDAQLKRFGILSADRDNIWSSAEEILSKGPESCSASGSTVLALGYVQSGKTTSITALAAAAADQGYSVIVALLGSTNLLLNQNSERLERSLEIVNRRDFVWNRYTNPTTDAAGKRLSDDVKRGRTVLVSVLKHAGRIDSVAKQLAKLPNDTKALIIDDEADQGSLNTSKTSESRTYSAIRNLRSALPTHLYVQYTATPYAPLLLESADILHPDAVEFLAPGTGYTGGKEFFIDHAGQVVRNVPMLDEQESKNLPIQLQTSLEQALASFLAGSAMLLDTGRAEPPISMLVHSTARNDVQQRYEYLINQQIKAWNRTVMASDPGSIPQIIQRERQLLVSNGAQDVDDQAFLEKLIFALQETTVWLVNSAAGINQVDWHVTPLHVLVGGNKLDRGFTVEGLTVTYMNRPASPQVDTLEQRARAFGYRGDLLPYCQFFASKRTVRSLTDIVHTEEDLRARLHDHVEAGGSVTTWANEIGLLLPEKMTPTRSAVVQALSKFNLGWYQQRIPVLDQTATNWNWQQVQSLGLDVAALVDHGRLEFRTVEVVDWQTLSTFLHEWKTESYSPGWQYDEILAAVERSFLKTKKATVVLMEESQRPRVRKWDSAIGFVNLFQGRDVNVIEGKPYYAGDRNMMGLDSNPDQLIVQVHRLKRRGQNNEQPVLALAIHVGSGVVVRKDDYV